MTGLTLALSTASPALSLALFEGETLVAHDHRLIGRGHAEAVVPALAALLGGRRPTAVLVDVGPGSFTGIRIGLAAARALGVAWGVPVLGFSGTGLVAAAARAANPGLAGVAAVIDAGRGQRFVEVIGDEGQGDGAGGDIVTLAAEALPPGPPPLAGDVPADIPAVWRGQPDCRHVLALPAAARSLPPAARYVRPPDAILPL